MKTTMTSITCRGVSDWLAIMKTTTISMISHSGIVLALLLIALVADAQDSPHWSKTDCQACHLAAAPGAKEHELKGGDAEALCESCHGDRGDAVACRHRSDVVAGDMTLADYYLPALRDGKVVCTTCHDLTFQCKNPRVAYSFQNPGFLRNRVSRKTGEQCFECHAADGFARLNPHEETFGSPPRKTCGLCHDGDPQSDSNSGRDVGFTVKRDLDDLCRGCHLVKPHPSGMSFGKRDEGWIHLVAPSAAILANIQEFEAAGGTPLPLSPINGNVMCATCHDPHSAPGHMTYTENHKLRLDDICQACHDK